MEESPGASDGPGRPGPILPPATIGILGGGQLGRMLGFAARTMGYRIVVLDPDAACPAAAIADRVVIGAYDDVEAALALAAECVVVTYELEHVTAAVVEAVGTVVPVRPGIGPLLVTQDRLAERRFVEGAGGDVAPWREVRVAADLAAAAGALGLPLRLKTAFGGYDGRGQVRVVGGNAAGDARGTVGSTATGLAGALAALGRPDGEPLLAERELDFAAELSVVVARGLDDVSVAFPPARNVHDAGILVESVAPAPIDDDVADHARALVVDLAEEMDLVGTLTAELFLLRDGSLVVNELAPRVHNSGHWTIEGAATSQFEQHVRAICGLPLGSSRAVGPTAIVNLLGAGPRRPARLDGIAHALRDPGVHVHLYDKREVFERRKMGHVTVVGETVDDVLDRARAAVARLRWGS